MKKRKMLRVIILVALVVSGGLLVLANVHHSEDAKAPEQKPGTPVLETVSLTLTTPTSRIKLPGDLLSWNETMLYAKVKSFVKTVNVDRGSIVRKGQVLAHLEAPELLANMSHEKARVNEIMARLQASQAHYARVFESSATVGAVSQNELDLALAQMRADSASLKSTQAAYDAMRELTQYLQVVAPYDGVIAYRGVSPGTLVGPEDNNKERPLFTIEDARTLRLTVAIPEKYVDELIDGTKVEFLVDALPHEVFPAWLRRKAEKVEQDVHSMMVEFDVDNASGRLKPGMYADVSVPIRRQQQTFNIPATALLNSTLGLFVISVEQGKTHWIPVTTGNSSDSTIEVFGKLEPGLKIVKKASEEIRDGG